MNATFEVDALAWGKMDGLLPAVVQHADTGDVLMVGYMNREALGATLNSGKVTFYSRSKKRLWQKGESSGNVLTLVAMHTDCDADSLLVKALPHGPTCHLGSTSCFAKATPNGLGFLGALQRVVDGREGEDPKTSYTARLLQGELRRVAQKVGEEGVETALAAVVEDESAFKGEAADLLYHLMVLCRAKGMSLAEVVTVLADRHGG